MDATRPSATAARTATDRAQHQLLDVPPLFPDPFAARLIGDDAVVPLGSPAPPHRRSLRAFLAARARFAEDHLAALHAQGLRHAVILGAGLDTFALRNPFPDLQVFEVDHPATQAWKRRRLAAAGLTLPASARLVAVDFTHDELGPALAAAGLPARAPTFFSWLGVTYYLPLADLTATLTTLAARGPGTALVCDTFLPASALSPGEQVAFTHFLHYARSVGEPVHSLFTPQAFAGLLRAQGFAPVEQLDADALTARYFLGRPDGLRPFARGQLTFATV